MTNDQREIEEDLDHAKLVGEGNDTACRKFVKEYTPWVLYKIKEWMKSHCHYSAWEYVCSLITLQNPQPTGGADDTRHGCDECIDSYVWIFDQLKRKVRSYKGINNCGLKAYVWTILNSKFLFSDWLRWRYGRPRPPECIKELGPAAEKVFVFLCWRKSVEEIARHLQTPLSEAERIGKKVEQTLIAAGMIHLIKSPVMVSSDLVTFCHFWVV